MNRIHDALREALPLYPLPWYSGGGLGWGPDCLQLAKNLLSHEGNIFQCVAIRESQHPNPHFAQSRGPLAVVFQLPLIRVLTAIKLHDQSARRAVKVNDIAGDRMLPTKSVAVQAFQTNCSPKSCLRMGWPSPHRSRKPQSPSIWIPRNLHRSNTVRPVPHDQGAARLPWGVPKNLSRNLLPPPLVLGGRNEVGGGTSDAMIGTYCGSRRSPTPTLPRSTRGGGREGTRRLEYDGLR
jgi:hypothetical protein